MKIVKFTIFLSILIGVFFVVYQQSNKKGFYRLWMSLKTATLIAAILAGLITNPVEAIEPDVPDKSASIERVLSNQELDSLDDPNSRVVLVKTNDTSPSVPTSFGRGEKGPPNNFPMGTTGGRRTPHINPYRTPPKLVDQGLGAAGNPAGAGNGGAAEFDDQCFGPKKQQSQKSKSEVFDSSLNPKKKNKKKSAEQCELDENVKDGKIEIVYRIKENPALVREAEKMGRNQAAQKDINHLIEQLSLGNKNPGIGNERVLGLKNVSEARGENGGRVYYREKNGKIEILAKSSKKNQKKVIDILKTMGY